jgi:hypothetical protein
MGVTGSRKIARDTGAWKIILREARILQGSQSQCRRCGISLVSPTPRNSQRTGHPHKNSYGCTRRKVVLFTLLLRKSNKNHSYKCVCKYLSAVSAHTSNDRETLKINVIFEVYVRFRLYVCDIHNSLPRKSHGKPSHRNIRCGCMGLTKETFPFSGL